MARFNEISGDGDARLFEVFNYNRERFFAQYKPGAPHHGVKRLVPHLHGHASGQNTPHNQVMAESFRKCGYPTLQIDARNSNSNGADGELDGFTMSGNVNDMQTVLNCVELYEDNWLRAGMPILSGHSMGGYTALRAAAGNENIAAVVAFCPVVSGLYLKRDVNWGLQDVTEEKFGNYNKSNITSAANRGEWNAHDLNDCVANIKVPVIIITGEYDMVTPESHVKALLTKFRVPVIHRSIKGDHRLQNAQGEVMVPDIDYHVSSALREFGL